MLSHQTDIYIVEVTSQHSARGLTATSFANDIEIVWGITTCLLQHQITHLLSKPPVKGNRPVQIYITYFQWYSEKIHTESSFLCTDQSCYESLKARHAFCKSFIGHWWFEIYHFVDRMTSFIMVYEITDNSAALKGLMQSPDFHISTVSCGLVTKMSGGKW